MHQFTFTNRVWHHAPAGGWYFISLPGELSAEIREKYSWDEEGWGRLNTTAEIHQVRRGTAIWWDNVISCR